MKKIRKVWRINGTAINTIWIGLVMITSACELKIMINVNKRPIVVTLSNLWTNESSKYLFPLRLTITNLVTTHNLLEEWQQIIIY